LGERIKVSGTLFTARDRAHKFLVDNNFDEIQGAVIYHCGPIVKDNKIIAAGPTTSSRMNMYMPKLIEKYNIKAFIGKGGIDKESVKAMKKHGCVYLSVTGGIGALTARRIKNIKNIYKKEFGMPEAIYELEVEDLPVTVTVDKEGNNLYDNIIKKSKERAEKICQK